MAGTSTGLASLPDIGSLIYNGVAWSCLYKSEMTGKVVLDDAKRTTKYVEWTLEVDGFVTLESGQKTTDATFQGLRQRLSAAGQGLIYQGKGFGNLFLNLPNGIQDVAYGPQPEVVSFQPLGQARGAMIKWNCVFRIPELANQGAGPQNTLGSVASAKGQVLQFSYSASIGYDEEGYAEVSLRGVLEVAASRNPAGDRLIKTSVDDFRAGWLNIAFDLTRYRISDRRFDESADQRSCNWTYLARELSPAGLPVGAMKAGGTMTIRPMRPGGGSSGTPFVYPRYVVTLRCNYAIRADFARRTAYWAFISLLWFRMWSCLRGAFPDVADIVGAGQRLQDATIARLDKVLKAGLPNLQPPSGDVGTFAFFQNLMMTEAQAGVAAKLFGKAGESALLSAPYIMDFGVDEGLYDDSKTISFQASWSVLTDFKTLLTGCGVWRYGPESNKEYWAASIQDVMGWRGPLAAQIDPGAEVIVDFGGGTSLTGPPVIS